MTITRRLRGLISAGGLPLMMPGAPNALAARVVEEAGFDAVYVTGAGVTNSYLGAPDLGLITLGELVGHVNAMADAVGIPVVVDGDTGFGNALNVQRTIKMVENAGAAGIQLEDQVSPKKCGHFSGKEVISADEMVGKLKAAADARKDDDFVIIARTDSIAVHGIDESIDRAGRYLEAGADVLFVEAPRDLEQMRKITTSVPGIHMANMVEGGLTPLLSREELRELGFSIALYANAAMRGAVAGMRKVMNHLAEVGDTREAGDLMISWADRQALVRKPEFDELDAKYSVTANSVKGKNG